MHVTFHYVTTSPRHHVALSALFAALFTLAPEPVHRQPGCSLFDIRIGIYVRNGELLILPHVLIRPHHDGMIVLGKRHVNVGHWQTSKRASEHQQYDDQYDEQWKRSNTHRNYG